jgi:hypothetical protein
MQGIFVFGLFFLIIAVLVILLSENSVIRGEAGIVSDGSHNLSKEKIKHISPFDYFKLRGKPFSMKKMYRVVICGDCMNTRGLCDGDLSFFEKVKQDALDSLTEGDILLLTYQDKGDTKYKIREFRGFYDENKLRLKTIRYENDQAVFSNLTNDNKTSGHPREHAVGNLVAFIHKNELN